MAIQLVQRTFVCFLFRKTIDLEAEGELPAQRRVGLEMEKESDSLFSGSGDTLSTKG